MAKNKYGNCPYCDYQGRLVWYKEEYMCQECKDHFSEDEQIRDHWESEYDKYFFEGE